MADDPEKILRDAAPRPAPNDTPVYDGRYLENQDTDGVPRTVSFFFRTAIFFNFICYVADRRYNGTRLAGKLDKFSKEHSKIYKCSLVADWIIRLVCILLVLAIAVGASWKIIFS